MQLHSGTFPSFHTLTWQCWNRWARDSPADGGDATLTDANRHKSHQKKKKKAGRVYAGEDVLLFSGTWQWGAVFVCCWCSSYVLWTSFQLFLKKSSLFANKRTWIVVSYHISYESIRRVTVSKSHIQLRHQRSPVIGSLAPRESVPATLQLSLTTKPTSVFLGMLLGLDVGNWRYWRFSWIRIPAPIHTWPHARNVPEHFRDRMHVWKGLQCILTYKWPF